MLIVMNVDPMNVVETLVEEVNDLFYKQVVAQERKGYLCLTDLRIDKYVDFEELELSLTDVFEHLQNTYDVDFDIITMNGRTIVLDVIKY